MIDFMGEVSQEGAPPSEVAVRLVRMAVTEIRRRRYQHASAEQSSMWRWDTENLAQQMFGTDLGWEQHAQSVFAS